MEDKKVEELSEFEKLLEKDDIKIPQVGDIVKGTVVAASKAEVKLDVNGVLMGIIRGPELYNDVEEFSSLKPGDEIEAAVIDAENEKLGLIDFGACVKYSSEDLKFYQNFLRYSATGEKELFLKTDERKKIQEEKKGNKMKFDKNYSK